MKEEDFDIILSKNRLARHIKMLHQELERHIPDYVLFDFDAVEKKTGIANQPTARNILISKNGI